MAKSTAKSKPKAAAKPAAKPKGPSPIVVIVTGGARGLGRSMTLALANAGARVAVVELASAKAQLAELMDLARQDGVADSIHAIECDVTRYSDCQNAVARTIAQFDAVHGLVNNAAIGMQGFGNVLVGKRNAFYEHDAAAWREAIDVNVNGPFNMAKAIAPALIAGGWGRIVNINTSLGTMTAEGFSPYGPTKAALEAATAIWARDLAGTGVTVNGLSPGGAANTRMIPEAEVADRSTLVQPEVMKAPIVWLMSTRSDGVTGRRIIAKEWGAARLDKATADKVGVPAGWGG